MVCFGFCATRSIFPEMKINKLFELAQPVYLTAGGTGFNTALLLLEVHLNINYK